MHTYNRIIANNAHQNVDMWREGKCIWPLCCATAPWLLSKNPNVLYQRINSTPTKVLLSQTLLCLWKNQSSPQHWDQLLSCGWVFIQRHQVRLWFSVNIAKLVNFFRPIFDSVGFELQFWPKQKKSIPVQIMWSANSWFFVQREDVK